MPSTDRMRRTADMVFACMPLCICCLTTSNGLRTATTATSADAAATTGAMPVPTSGAAVALTIS